jgi:hypothetical protein
VIADSRVQANAFDNLLAVETLAFSIAIQLIEIGYPQSKIGISKQLDRLRFGRIGKQRRDILLNAPSFSRLAKRSARSERSPMTIREG